MCVNTSIVNHLVATLASVGIAWQLSGWQLMCGQASLASSLASIPSLASVNPFTGKCLDSSDKREREGAATDVSVAVV